ncbi:MAG: hypothetical protein NTX91_02125 [candidate division SR1 bacterium]|nr:hypothetical protein [candidate division SR1 bacterium]
MAKQIIIGIFVAAIGGVLIYFSNYLVEAFGRNARAENKLGGTRNGYLLVGFGLMVLGLLFLFGVIPTSSPTANLPTLGTVK